MLRRVLPNAFLLAASFAAMPTARGAEPISLMPDSAYGAEWGFGIGAEFPGATGDLVPDSEMKKDGAETLKLTGDFSGGGAYVQAATGIFETDLSEVSFWLRDWPGERMSVRLVDSTGRCHQFSLKVAKTPDWQQIVLPVDKYFAGESVPIVEKYEAWGGEDKAKWKGPARNFVIVMGNPGGNKVAVAHIADVKIVPKAGAAAQASDFENGAEGWELKGGAAVDATGGFKGKSALAVPAGADRSAGPRFPVKAGIVQVSGAAKSDPAGAKGSVAIEFLDAAGKAVGSFPLFERPLETGWQPASREVAVPPKAVSGRFVIQPDPAGKIWVDDLAASPVVVARPDERIRSVRVTTSRRNNLFGPRDPREMKVEVTSSKPLGTDQMSVECKVVDFSNQPIAPAFRTELKQTGRAGQSYIYQAVANLAALPIVPGRYYELQARAEPGTRYDERGQSPFGVLPDFSARALTWSQAAGLADVRGVFPHPLLPGRALAPTATGLSLTEDAGRTWNALPEAARIGAVSVVAFHPARPDTFFLGGEKGVWVTDDAGKSVRQLATAAGGLAADAVADLIVFPADRSHQTLLAVHGEAATGLSRSVDGGRTWTVTNTAFHFERVAARPGDDKTIFLFGSSESEPDLVSLFTASTPGELAIELLRDRLFTDLAFGIARDSGLYVSTSDAGLYHREANNPDLVQIGPADAGWASVAATWGAFPDLTGICLYEPSQRGLVFSWDDMATTQTSPGPLVSTFVREGSYVRPNANGTVFYAFINDGLSVGRSPESVPEVSVQPPVTTPSRGDEGSMRNFADEFNEFAGFRGSSARAAEVFVKRAGSPAEFYRAHQTTISARLPKSPKSVVAELTRLGGGDAVSLRDDGRFGDRQAGDGVYEISFCFLPLTIQVKRDDWRPPRPGPATFGVTANYERSSENAVGLVGIYPVVETLEFWHPGREVNSKTEGEVTVTQVKDETAEKRRPGVITIQTGKGPWQALFPAAYDKEDIVGQGALSFWIKGRPPAELYVQLRDEPRLLAPATTEKVPVIAGGFVQGPLGAEYRRVLIPMARILQGGTQPLDPGRLKQLIFSGDAGEPVAFTIAAPRFQPTVDAQDSPP